jgi:hypothetical protein
VYSTDQVALKEVSQGLGGDDGAVEEEATLNPFRPPFDRVARS